MSEAAGGPRTALRSAVLWTLFTRVAVMPLGLVQGILLARLLGPAALGQYSALLTDINLTVTLLALGLPGALTVLVGERPTRLRRLLRLGLLCWLLLLVLPAGLVWLVAAQVPSGARLWTWLLRQPAELQLIAIAATVQALRDMVNSLLSGTQQFRAQNLQALLLSLFQLTLIGLLAYTSLGGVSPLSAAAVQVLSNLLLCVLGARSLHRVARVHRLWVRPGEEVAEERGLPRRAWHVALRNFLHIIPDILLLRIDVYLIQRLLPGGAYQQQLGLYQAGVRIAELVFLVPGTLNAVLFAKAAAREDLTRATIVGAKLSLYLGLLALLGMALFGQPALTLLYGPRFAGSFLPCLLVLLGCCTLCFSSPLAGTLAGVGGYPRSIIVAQVLALIVNVGANIYLIPRYDIIGAAAASALAYAVSAVIISAAFAARFRVSFADLLRPESPLRLLRDGFRQGEASARPHQG